MIYGQLNHAAPENGAAVKSPLGQPLPLPCLPPLLPLTNRRHVPCAGSHHGITAQRDRSIVAGGEPAVAPVPPSRPLRADTRLRDGHAGGSAAALHL